MIKFENISLKIHSQMLLNGANLSVAEGDKVVIRGASGCGKSSLLKCAVGGIPMETGSVSVDSIALSASSVTEIRSRIAFIGQEPVLGAENVRDALFLPFTYKVHRDRRPEMDTVMGMLERLHLSADILEKPSKRVSGGEKQRIAIARALLLDKQVFIADEITSALDPESKNAVMHELFRPEITLLSVSHDEDWIKNCPRVIEVKNGSLTEEGS